MLSKKLRSLEVKVNLPTDDLFGWRFSLQIRFDTLQQICLDRMSLLGKSCEIFSMISDIMRV
ncbi:CLUMA_CG010377, isoform A [Clunio marinus]|uniref:CLUMA_CG010377, isoform A n=1 Tax=Clunio marinus TaxID=568069 RepID=A0A1J1I9T1_9DIPT|nr:CLUMA_CG010377, isoform A [Clunio marinus]